MKVTIQMPSSTSLMLLYSDAGLLDRGPLGGSNSIGNAIKANGDVTGSSEYAMGSSLQHAFVYADREMHDLDFVGRRGPWLDGLACRELNVARNE